MFDISNKLHAMVDEFVFNLSSECDSLVNNMSAQGHKHVAHDSGPDAARAPRPSNRTTMEVLNELRRPSESQVMDYPNRERKSHVENGKSNLSEGAKKSSHNGRSSRQLQELSSKSASLEGMDHKKTTNQWSSVSTTYCPKLR